MLDAFGKADQLLKDFQEIGWASNPSERVLEIASQSPEVMEHISKLGQVVKMGFIAFIFFIRFVGLPFPLNQQACTLSKNLITDMAFSADNRYFISTWNTGEAKLWAINTWTSRTDFFSFTGGHFTGYNFSKRDLCSNRN